jgi:Zn-dependent protease with chaperone function
MSARLAILVLALLAAAVFAAATALAVAVLWPRLRGRLAGLHPALRARIVWLLAVSPSALPALLVGLCFVPGLLAALGLGSDHCLRHPDHAHLCLTHAHEPLTHAGMALLALAATLSGAALVPELVDLARTRRWLARLPRRAPAHAVSVEIVESETPLAFVAGLWRPRAHLASCLVERLPDAQLAAVVQHERAHARRRDPLLRLAARVLSRAHRPALRRELLRELAIASEEACDAEAARAVGDRLLVAEAILAAERIFAAALPVPTGLAGFDGDVVAARVQALLATEPSAPRRGVSLGALALGLCLGLLLADPLHHATEHLLALATRFFS